MEAKHLPKEPAAVGAREPAGPSADSGGQRPDLICALCGREFREKAALDRHNLTPHFRSNRIHVSAYQALN